LSPDAISTIDRLPSTACTHIHHWTDPSKGQLAYPRSMILMRKSTTLGNWWLLWEVKQTASWCPRLWSPLLVIILLLEIHYLFHDSWSLFFCIHVQAEGSQDPGNAKITKVWLLESLLDGQELKWLFGCSYLARSCSTLVLGLAIMDWGANVKITVQRAI